MHAHVCVYAMNVWNLRTRWLDWRNQIFLEPIGVYLSDVGIGRPLSMCVCIDLSWQCLPPCTQHIPRHSNQLKSSIFPTTADWASACRHHTYKYCIAVLSCIDILSYLHSDVIMQFRMKSLAIDRVILVGSRTMQPRNVLCWHTTPSLLGALATFLIH